MTAAIESPVGVAISCENPSSCSARLALVRNSNPELFGGIVICRSRDNPESELWIVNAPKK